MHIRKCEDSTGNVCNKLMLQEEHDQDGMCSACADNVWAEMTSDKDYHWYHEDVSVDN